jgi:septal ring factor EnvC (AmiA/AmiB activator)
LNPSVLCRKGTPFARKKIDPAMSSSSPDSLATDERKRKRALSNRESARRSRARKQQRLEQLVAEAARLQAENARALARIAAFEAELARVDGRNAVLRARHAELAAGLQALTGVLEVFQMAGERVDIPDPLLRPWQSPFPIHPIAADASPRY